MPIRVLIVDDHGIVRQGLRMYLGTDPEIEVVGEATNGREAVEQAHALRPDVVLMDLLMPEMNGIAATAIIRRNLPEVEVLALTSVLEEASVVEAVRAGATGYLLKDTGVEELCRGIHAAAAGQVRLAPAVANRLMSAVVAPSEVEQLTPREMEVLRLLALGRSNAEISRELDIHGQTVKSHVSHILTKLAVPSRTQAALYAVKMGIVPPAASLPVPGGQQRMESPSRAVPPTHQND